MKKKIFALAIALIMIAIVTLVGCDFAADGKDSGDSGKKPTTSSASAKNITVTVKEVQPSDPVEDEPTDIKSVLKRVEKTIVKVNYKTGKTTLTASGIVIKYLMISLCVTVTGPPSFICCLKRGITEPLEPRTLPKRTATNLVLLCLPNA